MSKDESNYHECASHVLGRVASVRMSTFHKTQLRALCLASFLSATEPLLSTPQSEPTFPVKRKICIFFTQKILLPNNYAWQAIDPGHKYV